MPRTRRSSKPRSELDENTRSLRELALFVEEPGGLRLGLATYDTPRVRQEQLDRLTEVLASRPVHLSRLDLSQTPGEKLLLQRLRDHLRDNPAPEGKSPAVMVVGLEATLDYRKLAPEASEGVAILRNANVQRDAFPKLCPVPVVIWLNPTATTKFAQEAPDFWHWRAGTFRFAGLPDERNQLAGHLSKPSTRDTDHLDRTGRLNRIVILNDLLLELEDGNGPDSPGNKARRAALYHEISSVYLSLANSDRAIEYSDCALKLFRAVGDRHGEASSIENMGAAHIQLGQLRQAISYYEQRLSIAREIGDRRGAVSSYLMLGIIYTQLGQFERAIDSGKQALSIVREIGDRQGEVHALGNLGDVFVDQGHYGQAIDYYERSLSIAREIGDRPDEGITLGRLGLVQSRLGQFEQAIGYYEEFLIIAREVGDRRLETAALTNLGVAHVEAGQLERAIDYYEQALSIDRSLGDLRAESYGLINLAIAHDRLGRTDEAFNLSEQALHIGREINDQGIIQAADQILWNCEVARARG
jgi:tetratricopeptide (TPR) repeat protein